MIPRTEAIWLRQGTSLDDFLKIYATSPAQRYPIYEETYDNVTGVVAISDVLGAVAQGSMQGGSDTSVANVGFKDDLVAVAVLQAEAEGGYGAHPAATADFAVGGFGEVMGCPARFFLISGGEDEENHPTPGWVIQTAPQFDFPVEEGLVVSRFKQLQYGMVGKPGLNQNLARIVTSCGATGSSGGL